MKSSEIKFQFKWENIDEKSLKSFFNKIGTELNIHFDKKSNIYTKNVDKTFDIQDVSDWEEERIRETINSFFSFSFDNTIDVPLFKFLVLKNNGEKYKYTILANIHSSIFDYTSIKTFYELFKKFNAKQIGNDDEKDFEDDSLKNKIISRQNSLNDYLNSAEFENDLQYWIQYQLNLGNYVKYYNIKSDSYSNIRIPLNNEKLSDFLKENDTSRFNFILSIFSLYLSRVDRTKGCLLKKTIPRNENEIGPFDINTISKVKYEKEYSFIDYLNQMENDCRYVNDHSKADINNYIKEELTFYSIYDFTDFENISILNGEKSALTLYVYKDSLELNFNDKLFEKKYIEHMLANMESLIDHAIASPNQLCGEMNILSDDENSLISNFCHGKKVEFDKDNTLALSFRKNSKKNPDKLAIDDGINKISYGELEKSSNSIAYDLNKNHKIGFASPVGLMLPRSYHFPEFVLALNKIGAVIIPIDTEYPIKRIEHMLNISESKHIITTKEIAQRIDLDVNLICIEEINYDINEEVEIKGKGNDLFGIMFTSGTTGLPKGVMVPNKQMSGYAEVHKHILCSEGEHDTVGSYASFSFVAMYWMLWGLYFGNSCRLFNENERSDFLLFMKALEECPLRCITLPTVLVKPLLENENIHIDYLISAGSKMNQLAKIKTNSGLCNAYGSTEIKATANVCDLDKEEFSIGSPLDNTWIYILDENLMQMPIGVAGEICISTDNLSLGYINNPEDTGKKFVENPYCDCEDNQILYHTGDIGFYNFEGKIEVIGRNDDQLSVRGFRIESNEILRIMQSFDSIKEIYLDVDNDTLMAYYTAEDDININELKDTLRSELPKYMIPSLFIELEKIPLNVNGKIDKFALKATTLESTDLVIDDEILKIVVDSFKKVLNRDSILWDDEFVALGGNSLSAMKLQLMLKEKLDVHLSSNEIIELSTATDIANHIKFNLNAHRTIEEVNYSFDEPCLMSESQLNVYLDEAMNETGTAYNNPFKIHFKKKYSIDEIKDALSELIKIHPILKSRLLIEKGSFPECVFDGKIDIKEGSLEDIETFVEPFDREKGLTRFLIAKDKESVILCCDFHHLIFDGTSLNIFLNKLYSILNNETIDFTDNGYLRQISFEENVDSNYMHEAQIFLDSMLADRDEVYELLPSINKKEDGDVNICKEESKLPNRDKEKEAGLLPLIDDEVESLYISSFNIDGDYLRDFLQIQSITYNQFFTSVFAYTLSRFTGSSKVLFNLVEDGRGHVNLSDSIGMFVRTLPLLIDCKDQEISSFLKNSSNLINTVMKYDLYPFRVLSYEYDLNSDIIFQYSHSLFNRIFDDESDFEIQDLKHDVEGDMAFNVFNLKDNKLAIKVSYSEKFSKEFIEDFTITYKLIIEGMIHCKKLSEINYTLKSDLEILDNINHTEHKLDYEDILDAFNENLSKHPDNYLVSFKDRKYTYREGAYIAEKIAKRLRDLGIRPQENVGFLVEMSELYMFCVLGVMSIGAIYVPLDDKHPDKRIQFILEDTQSRVLIVDDNTYKRAESLTEDVILLNISDLVKENLGTSDDLPIVYGDLACILYTSGTTGVPKGVKVTRKAALNVPSYYNDAYGLGSDDVYGMYASIGFDAGSLAILSTICAGACLSVIPEDIRLDMNAMNDYFIKHNITHTFITTQVGKMFVNNVEDTSLDVLVVGGEKLGEFASPKNYKLIDIYGPTEAFVFVASKNNNDKIDSSSVGDLIYNTKAYILDDETRRVPVGAVGELYLAGDQISQGYLNREEETAHAFIDNPFGERDYGVLYRTGDMARVLPDKSLAVVGRRDSQVKIRGNRVELSEIEAVIREIPFVDDVTVQTVKNGSNNELVAYVTLSGQIIDLKYSIQDYVSRNKPQYMVPRYVINLEKIPLNVNGKVDKKRLPEVRVESNAEYEVPQTYVEELIAEGFGKVLGISRPISRNEEFTSLGGDSISVMMLIVKLRESNINISVKDVLNNQSVRKIAENADFTLSNKQISQEPFEGYVDTTPIIQHFWDSNFRNPSYFNQGLLFECSKRIDESILKEAMLNIVNHHDLLRAKVKDGKLFVGKTGAEEYFTIENCNPNDYANETLRLNEEIDIFNGPLIKLGIFREDEFDNLYIVIHHLLVDGVSWRIITEDLNLAYMQLINHMKISLPDKTSQYQDYALAINDYRNHEDLLKQKGYWENTLNSMKVGNHTKIDSKIRKMESILLKFSKEKSTLLLTNAPKHYNSSINGIFLSAISKAWKNIMGEEELSIRMEGHGRYDFDENIVIDRTVGWFTTAYPIILKNKGETNEDIIANIERILEDVPQNGFGYPPLMGIETDTLPLLTFNYLGEMNKFKTGEMFIARYNSDLANFTPLENNYGTDINLNGYSLNRDTHFNLEYNSERFEREIMEKFAKEFLKALDEIVVSCDDEEYSGDIHTFSNHPNKKNLFFIHSASYGSEFFYYIAEELKDDYSFRVFEPYNINHKENPLTSIEEFSEKYIKILKSIQKEGPYYIGGLCFGGAIALEMAEELKKQVEEVKLIILDAHYIDDENLRDMLVEDQILYARQYQNEGALAPKDKTIDDMVFHAKLASKIWLDYVPKHYDGETIYFRANIRPEDGLSEAANGLYEYVFSKKAGGYEYFLDEKKFRIVNVPAEHNNMFSAESLKVMIPEMNRFINEE